MSILCTVIVKLFELVIEKKSLEEIFLVYALRIPSEFFDRSTLEKIEVLHRENDELDYNPRQEKKHKDILTMIYLAEPRITHITLVLSKKY